MATTVTKSIGTSSRDYSTMQAWEDAIPANIVTADQVHVGELYNDSEFLNIDFTISNHSADATRYIHLTVAAGHSFQDHANVRTNALRYNISNGVGWRRTATYGPMLLSDSHFTRVSRIQLKVTSANTEGIKFRTCGSHRVSDSLFEGRGRGLGTTFGNFIYTGAGNSYFINCTFVITDTIAQGIYIQGVGGPETFIGCTFVRAYDLGVSGTMIYVNYTTTHVLRSCVFLGFTNAVDSTAKWHSTNSKYNASDQASGLPGTNTIYSVTYSQTTPFTDADKDSLDMRAIASTALAGAGFLDSTNAPLDISKTTRAASPTIGHWELSAAPTVELTREQGTGKIVADSPATSVAITFSTPPTVGNGIIVPLSIYSTGGSPVSCVDNQGNTYTLAKQQTDGTRFALIYFCSAITTSGTPFTITVTFSVATYFVASAIEISGVEDGLEVDKTAGATSGSSSAISTGSTATLTADEVLSVGVYSFNASLASSTVESVSPAWTEEHEELFFTHAVGEADSRVLTGMTGLTTSINWTASTAAAYAAALATFKATMAVTITENVQISIII